MAGMMGTKMSPKVLMAALEPVALLGALRLGLVLAHGGSAGLGDKRIVDLVDRAGAEDDLKLSLGFKDALDAGDVLQGSLVHLLVVRDDQPEPCGTVGRGDDVFLAADAF